MKFGNNLFSFTYVENISEIPISQALFRSKDLTVSY
jgi:hypothetical protein